MQWLSEWETLVGSPVVDDTPREAPRLDGNVIVGEDATNAIYVDLAEFPGTLAFGAWWYLGVQDDLPRRFELVYYDVRGDDNQSVGDGISRLTISDLRVLDSQTEIAAAIQNAAKIHDETNWREAGEQPISQLLSEADPFTLPAPDGFETKAYQPPADQQRQQAQAEPALNIPAPDFTLLDPDGNAHTLSDYLGKIVILDFWATWCGPCLMVMPDIQAVHEKHKDKGVVVIGVNAWENGDPKALMDARGWNYLLLLGGDQVAADYQVSGIPTMVVIDTNGMIVQRKVGAGGDVQADLTQTIESLQPQH
jgi:thiol-disulfide isomerase/thioredoxin